MNRFLLIPIAFAATVATAAVAPSVSSVSVTQQSDRTLVVGYTLVDGPAVVTFDVQTNGVSGWASVGGAALSVAMGDVNVLVPASDAAREIRWLPDFLRTESAISIGDVRVSVTAWPTNNPPDVMVVDLRENVSPRVRYYTDFDSLPGGLLDNSMYRESAIVLRRIHADGIPWAMGSVSDGTAHAVTLANDYYIGVFELTQAQHRLALEPYAGSVTVYYTREGACRPSERISYNILRGTTGNTSSTPETNTPEPTATSLLGRLRSLTGIAFEMPTEAEWEFAARAGALESNYTEGRYSTNGGKNGSSLYLASIGPTNATAIVGSYAANAWGLYDMGGNVEEWCRDWYTADISGLGGACVTEKQESTYRVIRGGGIFTGVVKGTDRRSLPQHSTMDNFGNFVGYRPYAPCEAK